MSPTKPDPGQRCFVHFRDGPFDGFSRLSDDVPAVGATGVFAERGLPGPVFNLGPCLVQIERRKYHRYERVDRTTAKWRGVTDDPKRPVPGFNSPAQ